MGSVSTPDCPTEPRLGWIHFLGSKKNRKNDGKAQIRGVPKNNKGKVEWRQDGSTGKINKDETNILVLPGTGGSGSAFHKEKERKNNPKMGGFDSHPSVP